MFILLRCVCAPPTNGLKSSGDFSYWGSFQVRFGVIKRASYWCCLSNFQLSAQFLPGLFIPGSGQPEHIFNSKWPMLVWYLSHALKFCTLLLMTLYCRHTHAAWNPLHLSCFSLPQARVEYSSRFGGRGWGWEAQRVALSLGNGVVHKLSKRIFSPCWLPWCQVGCLAMGGECFFVFFIRKFRRWAWWRSVKRLPQITF